MLQTLAAMATPMTVDFTLADNTSVTLTTTEMVTVGLLMGQKSQTAYGLARVKRILLDEATTVAEVEAIS